MCDYWINLFQTQSSYLLKTWMGINVVVYIFTFANSTKWNTSICQILFLWKVPFGLLSAGSGVWLYEEQVGYFIIISLACCHMIEKSFYKLLLLAWCFLWNFEAFSTFPTKNWLISSLPCSWGPRRPIWDQMCIM